jgi:hypothetical protein
MVKEVSGAFARLEMPAGFSPSISQFFLSPPTVAVDRRGDYLVKVEETEAGLRFTSLNLANGREAVRNFAVDPAPLQGTEVNVVLSRWAERNSERLSLQPARIRSMLRDAMTIPDHQPRFTEVFAGAEGFVWVRGFTTSDQVLWTRYSLAGEPNASVTLRSGDEVMDAGGDWLWIMRRNELDVPRLIRGELRSPSPVTPGSRSGL